jgi:hypothetical protein
MQKLYLYIFGSISFLAVLFQGCVSLPTDVIMPQWDADLNVPITTKIYNLNDIIKSPDYISINSQDNTYMITSDSLGQNVPVSQFIQINTERSTPTAPVLADGKTTIEAFIPFPEGAKIIQAGISKGTFKVVAHNSFPIDVQLTINIPGMTKGGTLLSITFTVPANTASKTQIIDFVDCLYIQPTNQTASKDGQLWMKASASSGSGLAVITFESYTSNFIFSSMTGYLPTKSLGTHSSSFALNLGNAANYRDKVVLKTGSLSLTGIYHSLAPNPFIVGVNNLHLVGKRNNSQLTDTLRFTNPTSNTFKFDALGNYSTVYDQNNSNITSFITFLPDSIYVSAEYIMNPDDDPAYKTVRFDDSISFVTRFTSKSVLSIKQATFTDTVNIDIAQDKRDQILNGKGAQLTVDIQNAIPLNSWIKVTLTDNDYHPLIINGAAFVITKNNNGTDSVSIAGSQTDGNGNYVSSSASNTTVTLDSLQIRQFSQNAYHAIISVTVETSHNNNVPVIVHASDWIKLNVFGRVTFRINGNK